jgi:hypothetical protein
MDLVAYTLGILVVIGIEAFRKRRNEYG